MIQMSTSDTRTPITRRPSALVVAGVLIVALIAGCGGSSYSSPGASGASAEGTHAKLAAPTTEKQVPTAGAKTDAIPQNNGGDQDADNNGGPSDGDGNL